MAVGGPGGAGSPASNAGGDATGAEVQRALTAAAKTRPTLTARPGQAYALLAEPVDAAVDAERLVFRRSFTDAIAGVAPETTRAALAEMAAAGATTDDS